MDEKLNVSKGK